MFDDFAIIEEEKQLQPQNTPQDNNTSSLSDIAQYIDDSSVLDAIEVDRNLPLELENIAEEIESELKSENPGVHFNFNEFSAQRDADEREAIEDSITNLQTLLANQFAEFKNLPYRLYAVFMHRGSVSFGHYWIYLYDFRKDIWRKYNDEYVTEVQNLDEIFYNLNDTNPSTPYFLVYVNDNMIDRLVEPVCRKIPQYWSSETTEQAPLYATDGMNMDLAFNEAVSEPVKKSQGAPFENATSPLRQEDWYWPTTES